MNLAQDTLTIYNARYDQETDRNVYVPTVIRGISWYTTIKTNVTDRGLQSANAFIIRIPTDADFGGKEYCTPSAWIELEDPSGYFTIQQGDHIVRGAASGEEKTMKELHGEHIGEACTVSGVTDNRRAPNAPHWKVVGA